MMYALLRNSGKDKLTNVDYETADMQSHSIGAEQCFF
jgi:hypothetical protein